VLAPGPAFAKPVAEMVLGMAIDLCRGVATVDRAMRRGQEKWLLDGAEGCFSLYGERVGLIGFGDLAGAFTPLLAPFGCPIKASDPWVSDHFMAGFGVVSASLEGVLKTSEVIVVFAAVTSDNEGFLGKREFEMIAPGSVFLLMSRAGWSISPNSCVKSSAVRFAPRPTSFRKSPRRATMWRARSRGCCCRRIGPAR
jgi:phosphoglycerate dehydrogenase-like enzyme